jgi:hypothetical protein
MFRNGAWARAPFWNGGGKARKRLWWDCLDFRCRGTGRVEGRGLPPFRQKKGERMGHPVCAQDDGKAASLRLRSGPAFDFAVLRMTSEGGSRPSQVRKSGSPPHGRRPVRGDPGSGAPALLRSGWKGAGRSKGCTRMGLLYKVARGSVAGAIQRSAKANSGGLGAGSAVCGG